MIAFTDLLQSLFFLANTFAKSGSFGDGHAFERRIERHLAEVGVRPVEAFSGVRSLGSQSLSGLYHQVDATGQTRDAVVIGEWKAYQGRIPKNELLRFKAATDDYWLRQQPYALSPVMRVFGGTGTASPALRRYAAHWGICLFTPDLWPSPLLSSRTTSWLGHAPDTSVQRQLAWLARPHGAVMTPRADGGWSIPRFASDTALDHVLALQDRWSAERWRQYKASPQRLQQLKSEMNSRQAAA